MKREAKLWEKSGLHGRLSLPEYWERSRRQIAEDRKWGTRVRTSTDKNKRRSVEEGKNVYMRQCDLHMNTLAPFLPNKSMSDLTAYELLQAIRGS